MQLSEPLRHVVSTSREHTKKLKSYSLFSCSGGFPTVDDVFNISLPFTSLTSMLWHWTQVFYGPAVERSAICYYALLSIVERADVFKGILVDTQKQLIDCRLLVVHIFFSFFSAALLCFPPHAYVSSAILTFAFVRQWLKKFPSKPADVWEAANGKTPKSHVVVEFISIHIFQGWGASSLGWKRKEKTQRENCDVEILFGKNKKRVGRSHSHGSHGVDDGILFGGRLEKQQKLLRRLISSVQNCRPESRKRLKWKREWVELISLI